MEEQSDARAEALMFGMEALDDHSLLGVLLGKAPGGRPPDRLAAEVLTRAGGLIGLGRCGPAALAEITGIGQARAIRLCASFELSRRLALRSAEPRPELADAGAVADFFAARIGDLPHEEMWVVSLDGRNRMRGLRRVAQGGVHRMAFSPADVLRPTLWDGAVRCVMVHNHPSGDPSPSVEDQETTARVRGAAEQLGVELVDHVIVTAAGHFVSLRDFGAVGGVAARGDGA